MKKINNICIITQSLGVGGAEKVASLQSKMLTDLGYNVYIVSILNYIDYEYSGILLNLGEHKERNDRVFNKLERGLMLRRFLKKNKIDLIIDHRARNRFLSEFIMHFFVFKIETVFVVHSGNLDQSFPKNNVISKFFYKRSHLVCVSKGIEKLVRERFDFKKTVSIYNPITLETTKDDKSYNSGFQYILFYGRLEEESKNITFLIDAFNASILPSKKIKLLLLGDGPDKKMYQNQVKKLQLQDHVLFKKRTLDPISIIKGAKFTVLTSNFEGFPLTIVESLTCETPVVSVNCNTGPSELIMHKHNGLLVEKNQLNYTQALDSMILDKEMYAECKRNCSKSIEDLSYENIKNEWEVFLKNSFK